jgi:hypothetical protein
LTPTTEAPTAFQAARDRAAAKALPAGPYLSAEEKAEMYANHTPFWLVDIQHKENTQYGERISFVVVLDLAIAENGEFDAETSRTLDLQASPFRYELMNELKPILAASKFVGPLYLAKFKTGGGKDAWDFTDEAPTT